MTPFHDAQPPPRPPPAAVVPAASPELLLLSPEQAQAFLRMIESASAVRRRYQFFVWTQSQMQSLVPHQVMVCGAYQRQRRSVVFDTFHNVVLSPELLTMLGDAEGPLSRALTTLWVEARGQPVAVPINRLGPEARQVGARLRDELGADELLVHGVARPYRPAEIESLFIFGGPASAERNNQRLACLDLLLPQLHRTWQRVVATEHELLRPAPQPAEQLQPPPPQPGPVRKGITPRECQILRWVRDGKSNQKIAEALGISPLTVKNHVQKILRKLSASNRAQAVALAMDLGLLSDPALAPHGAHADAT